MAELHLDHFMAAARDYESAQYRVLHGLQATRHAFSRNVVYPHLSSLMRIQSALQRIQAGMDAVRKEMEQQAQMRNQGAKISQLEESLGHTNLVWL